MSNRLLAIILFLPFGIFSQTNKNELYRTLYSNMKEDTNKVIQLNALGNFLVSLNPDSTILLGQKALQISKKLNYLLGEAKSYGTIGQAHLETGNFDKAQENYYAALKLYELLKDNSGIEDYKGNIGIIYANQGDMQKAFDHFEEAYKIAKSIEDKEGMAAWLGNIASVYSEQEKYDKALETYDEVISIDMKLGDKLGLAVDKGNKASVYKRKGDFEKALELNFETLKLREELGARKLVSSTTSNIGQIYMVLERYDEAEKYYLEALKITREIKAKDYESKIEENLSTLYELKGDYRNALEHHKRAVILNDTLFNIEKQKEIARNEIKYNFEKQITKTKEEQEKKDFVSKVVIGCVSAGFLIFVILSFVIYRSYRIKKRANILVNEQKRIVEEKQQEILSSIRYAKRIQNSLLPNEKYIDRIISQSQKEKKDY